jgi:hypothetical protein
VRDVDDGQAARFQTFDESEQRVHVSLTEAARRLVEHEDATAHGQRARDFHQLLRRRLKIADDRVG